MEGSSRRKCAVQSHSCAELGTGIASCGMSAQIAAALLARLANPAPQQAARGAGRAHHVGPLDQLERPVLRLGDGGALSTQSPVLM